MMKLLSITAVAAVTLAIANAAAAERPTYETNGIPITPHQVAVMGSADVRQQSPTPTLTQGGMPASPHQIAVLSPRPQVIEATAVTLTDGAVAAR